MMLFLKHLWDKLKLIGNAILSLFWYLFIGSIIFMMVSYTLVLTFMAIKNTTGYCTPFMLAFIKFECDTTEEALKMWADA